MNDILLGAAKKYIKAGISVIATDSNKKSLFPWKKYEQNLITVEEITKQLEHHKAEGIAIVCGGVSGGLEVIDVDLKYALSGEFFEILKSKIPLELYGKLLVIKTKSDGYHFYYRCEEIKGNQKLAMRLPTDEEKKDNPQIKHMTLIETRGQGGYVVAPPTPGYQTIQGRNINLISIDERELLLEACRSLNEVFEQEQPPQRTGGKDYGISPMEDYNKRGDVVELLERHGWKKVRDTPEKVIFKRPGKTDSQSSGDYNKTLNWFSVFTTNSCFEPNKAYLPYAVFAMLECGGDYKEACKKLAELGYGEKKQSFGVEKEVFKRRQNGATREDLEKYLINVEKKSSEEAIEILDKLEAQWGEKICTFWDVDKNGKIMINRYRLERFLSEVGGFHLYFYDKNSKIYRVVKVKDGFVEEASTEQIKKFIKDYVNTLPETFDGGTTPQELMEVIYKGSETYFTKSFIEFLDHTNLDLLKDDFNKAYFPFRNGVVVVDKDKWVLQSYGETGKVIWKSEVIDFDITPDNDFDITLCEFARFLEKISGDEEDRRNYCLGLMGYMLHKYKDPTKPYAVILAEETEREDEGGGTGKGIFVKAMSYLLNTERVDGKNFKLDKNFAFQRVGLDTKLIAIEDVRRQVDFEGFYSIITEGITVEKKNKDELFIPYKDSPKIVFTTNYTIPSTGTHAKRRQRVFEFANTFSSSFTPMDFFGHKLFDDWDDDEWNRFYNLMFFAVSMYLQSGVREVINTEKLKRKHIRLSFGEEFLDYYQDMVTDGLNGAWRVFNIEYNSFLKVNDFEKKEYSAKKFKKGLSISSETFGKKMENRRNRQIANQTEFRITD